MFREFILYCKECGDNLASGFDHDWLDPFLADHLVKGHRAWIREEVWDDEEWDED